MNDRVKSDLIEEFMDRALEIALEMDNGTLPVEDLTQEAYLGLVTGVEAISRAEEGDLDAADRLPIRETIEDAIRMQIRAALASWADAEARDRELIARAELLNTVVDNLARELGMKPTVDEIANAMKLSQETVMEIMKLMGETIPEDEEGERASAADFWINNPDLRGLRS
ncbi:MAG: hypothetical protein K6E30_11350 [Lachnospiraceae bacterium]|nr:hypothetical protein [Lachnospiraceae bacterium]